MSIEIAFSIVTTFIKIVLHLEYIKCHLHSLIQNSLNCIQKWDSYSKLNIEIHFKVLLGFLFVQHSRTIYVSLGNLKSIPKVGRYMCAVPTSEKWLYG